MEGTAALRAAAPRWSLAGDRQLLDLLQEIHQNRSPRQSVQQPHDQPRAPRPQPASARAPPNEVNDLISRIITKCNETNKRLEEMSRGLRDASVNLQNVNNKFLALSNTQFVESRVYEDDTDVTPPVTDKEPPQAADITSDLTKLKESLRVLESYHEPLLIVRDSDSDSDSDDNDDRLVLKPRDLYADRPLPHIIGSQAWKSKWHAGLVADESDSDSSTSKVEEVEQYSDSDEERATQDYGSPAQDYEPARKTSTGSSSLASARASPPRAPASPPRAPAAVAAELARRLGGDVTVPAREPVYTQPEPVVRKLYKPQEPLATTIFPDEPPPLDDGSSDDDIFAELHKTQPKAHSNRVDDLFDFTPKPSDLEEALFGPPKAQTNRIVDKPPLLDEEEPEANERPKISVNEHPGDNIKKPVGGISLFGTNKHAESIGAAILKRHRRKSSTSGDESNTEDVKVKEVIPEKEQEVKKERDIFDDLFAKSERINKKNAKTEAKTREVKPDVVQPKEVNKKDIFSDIFDDIDDIFSSDIVNVQVKETKNNEKALFSDDDDLFAEISKVKNDSGKDKVVASEKSDLFSDVTPKAKKVESNQKSELFADVAPKVDKIKKESKVIEEIKQTKSLFDSDSDDGLFTNVAKDVKRSTNQTEKPVEYKLKDDLFDDNEDAGLFAKNISKPEEVPKDTSKITEISKKGLFDSDDELFKDTKILNEVKSKTTPNRNLDANISNNNNRLIDESREKAAKTHNIVNSVKIESDDVKPKRESITPTVTDSINNDLFNDEVPPESPKESTPEVSHDSFDDDASYTTNTIFKNKTNETTNFTQDSQNNKIDDQTFCDKPYEQTVLKENILRTTRIASDEEIPAEPKAQDIFNDSDDDLFRNKTNVSSVSSKQAEESTKTTISQSPELLTTLSNKNDIFSDIFDDVPPVFEKPKEPKKSKNVNALFDDDSDDEALFFKKNDVIVDEKLEFNPSQERFGIFSDEPPAIDVDFTQKPSKKEDLLPTQTTDDVPPPLDKLDDLSPKPIKTDNIVDKTNDFLSQGSQDATDNINKEPKKIGKLKPMNININVNSLLPGASPKKKQVKTLDIKQEQTASNEELHKTDKIEPKMVKSISFDDPEILDNKISKERAKIQVKRRPSTRRARKEAARKSAIDFTDSSFDSSNDNSTKEEVQEKIVKTVYILNDDDIFGTSNTNNESIESTKKHLNIVDSDEELFKKPEHITDKRDVNLTNDCKKTTVDRKSSIESDDNDIFNTPSSKTNIVNDETDAIVNTVDPSGNKTHLESNENVHMPDDKEVKEIKHESVIKESESKSFLDSDDGDDLFRQTNKKSSVKPTNEPNIDSDEELFRNAPKTQSQALEEPKPFLESDDDDLFKTKTKEIKPSLKPNVSSDEDLFRNKGIATLGKVYKASDTIIKEHNIFDDFPAKINVEDNSDVIQSTVKETDVIQSTLKETIEEKPVKDEKLKSILDDLSDEDELFKSRTKLINKKDTSLFGDADDDDLFGTKSVNEVKPAAPVAPPTKEPKPAEPVFVDPLSLFGDDD